MVWACRSIRPDRMRGKKMRNKWYVLSGGYTEPIQMGSGEIVPGRGEGIGLFTMDGETGEMARLAMMPCNPNPSYLTLSKDGNYLYSVNELKEYHGIPGSLVSAYRLNKEAGTMEFLGSQFTCGMDACYVQLWQDEKWLLTANYSGGSIAVFPVLDDGSLGHASCVLRHAGHGTHPDRQAGPHPHQILPAPDGCHVYVPDLGLDKLVCYRMDTENGWLVKDHWQDIAGIPGQGVRHGVFDSTGTRLYVMTEMAAQVNVYRYDPQSGEALLMQTCDTVEHEGWLLGAAVRLHASGKWLYVSVRGANQLVVFRVEEDGILTKLQTISSGGQIPRDFILTPDGRFLLAANQDSDNVCVFAVDADTGMLTQSFAQDHIGAVTVLQITE